VPSRLAVFHSNVMNANAFVKTTATAPKNSAAAHNQECQFLVSNVCITLKVFAVRLDNSRHVPAIGPRICLPPEEVGCVVYSVHLNKADQGENSKRCADKLQYNVTVSGAFRNDCARQRTRIVLRKLGAGRNA